MELPHASTARILLSGCNTSTFWGGSQKPFYGHAEAKQCVPHHAQLAQTLVAEPTRFLQQLPSPPPKLFFAVKWRHLVANLLENRFCSVFKTSQTFSASRSIRADATTAEADKCSAAQAFFCVEMAAFDWQLRKIYTSAQHRRNHASTAPNNIGCRADSFAPCARPAAQALLRNSMAGPDREAHRASAHTAPPCALGPRSGRTAVPILPMKRTKNTSSHASRIVFGPRRLRATYERLLATAPARPPPACLAVAAQGA